jgi:hypothetical protein
VSLTDSLTYNDVPLNLKVLGQLTLSAGVEQRPVIRLSPTAGEWRFSGTTSSSPPTRSCLVLDGLWVCGADIVLAGEFDCVTITCCTLRSIKFVGTGKGRLTGIRHFVLAEWRCYSLFGLGRILANPARHKH